jgi:hypothetical protein
MTKKESSGRKAIESYIKHEDIIDNAVKLGKAKKLKVEATEGNSSKGDIRVASKDSEVFLDLLGKTIDMNQIKRSKKNNDR